MAIDVISSMLVCKWNVSATARLTNRELDFNDLKTVLSNAMAMQSHCNGNSWLTTYFIHLYLELCEIHLLLKLCFFGKACLLA